MKILANEDRISAKIIDSWSEITNDDFRVYIDINPVSLVISNVIQLKTNTSNVSLRLTHEKALELKKFLNDYLPDE